MGVAFIDGPGGSHWCRWTRRSRLRRWTGGVALASLNQCVPMALLNHDGGACVAGPEGAAGVAIVAIKGVSSLTALENIDHGNMSTIFNLSHAICNARCSTSQTICQIFASDICSPASADSLSTTMTRPFLHNLPTLACHCIERRRQFRYHRRWHSCTLREGTREYPKFEGCRGAASGMAVTSVVPICLVPESDGGWSARGVAIRACPLPTSTSCPPCVSCALSTCDKTRGILKCRT